MAKWEYLAFVRAAGAWSNDKYDGRSQQEKLSDLGKEDWELVLVCYDSSGYNFYLKRPLTTRRAATKKTKSTVKSTKKYKIF